MRRAQRRKYHYFYKTICVITNRYYYGMHSTDNLDDGYIGSGKQLWYSIHKYGKENHVCEKLEFFDTREKLKQREIEFVNEDLLKDPMCMNLSVGGEGGLHNEEHYKKWQLAGAIAGGKVTVKNLHFRQVHDAEYRKRWLQSLKDANNVGFTGKKHKEETKEKMSKTHKNNNHQVGEKNSQYGTCWITNDKENKKIKKGDMIPNGWRLGRKF